MTKSYLAYNEIRSIIEAGELPVRPSLYKEDILEILRICYNENSCRACKTKDDLTVDHILPRKLHGSRRNLNNLQVLCKLCNGIKGDQPPGQNQWWPDSLKQYLSNGKFIWNASKLRYEDN